MPDSLPIIAELGIGLAGFSSIVVAIGGQALSMDPLDRARVYGLLYASLSTAILAVWPIALADAGLSSESVWRVASASAAFMIAGFLYTALRNTRWIPAESRRLLHPVMWTIIFGGNGIALLALLGNVVGWPSSTSSTPYVCTLIYLLVYGGIQFMRVLTVRPDGVAAND